VCKGGLSCGSGGIWRYLCDIGHSKQSTGGKGGGRGRKMSMNRPRNVKETTTTKTTLFVISCKLNEQK